MNLIAMTDSLFETDETAILTVTRAYSTAGLAANKLFEIGQTGGAVTILQAPEFISDADKNVDTTVRPFPINADYYNKVYVFGEYEYTIKLIITTIEVAKNRPVKFSMSSESHPGEFTIDSETGYIKSTKPIKDLYGQQFTVRIRVADKENPELYDEANVTISVCQFIVNTLEFTGDYQGLIDNNTDYTANGNVISGPEWTKSGTNQPSSYVKDEKIHIILGMTVKSPLPFSIKGTSDKECLEFQSTQYAAMNTTTAAFSMTAKAKLPNKIDIVKDSIAWDVLIGDQERFLGSTRSHTIYVTYDSPILSYTASNPTVYTYENAITTKRLDWSCEIAKGAQRSRRPLVKSRMSWDIMEFLREKQGQ